MPPALVVNHKLKDCKYVGKMMNNVGTLTKRSSVTIDVAYVGYVTEQIAIKWKKKKNSKDQEAKRPMDYKYIKMLSNRLIP